MSSSFIQDQPYPNAAENQQTGTQPRSVFTVLHEMQDRMKTVKEENKQLREKLQNLRLELKNERVKYQNTQAVLEVKNGLQTNNHSYT